MEANQFFKSWPLKNLFSAELHAVSGIKELNQLGFFTNIKRHMEVAHKFAPLDHGKLSPFLRRFSDRLQTLRFMADIWYVNALDVGD